MKNIDRQLALVTGASSGIGRAIAIALARAGVHVIGVGRNLSALDALTAEQPGITPHQADLLDDAHIDALCDTIAARHGRLDLLIHNAALYKRGPVASAPVADFDAQYAANVRAPYRLTQRLLPLLTQPRGQIAFINSTVSHGAGRELSQYAATKLALKGLADSLRAEVNPLGVRVLSVYVGRTATPMQQTAAAAVGATYQPDTLLQPEDVAAVVLNAFAMPWSAEITEVTVRPMKP
jgi:NADP-dependent 3-hydroxy acid dehydrogenase YdfG